MLVFLTSISVYVTEAITFSNMQAGIADINVFDIPASCNDAQVFPVSLHHLCFISQKYFICEVDMNI